MNMLWYTIPADTRRLYHADGRPVAVGDTVTSFRGEIYRVTGWPTNGHNRVYVRSRDKADAEFFPAVFDLKWGS